MGLGSWVSGARKPRHLYAKVCMYALEDRLLSFEALVDPFEKTVAERPEKS